MRLLTLVVARTRRLFDTVLAVASAIRLGRMLRTTPGPFVPLTLVTPLLPIFMLVPMMFRPVLTTAMPATMRLSVFLLEATAPVSFTLLWTAPLLLQMILLLHLCRLPLTLMQRLALFSWTPLLMAGLKRPPHLRCETAVTLLTPQRRRPPLQWFWYCPLKRLRISYVGSRVWYVHALGNRRVYFCCLHTLLLDCRS